MKTQETLTNAITHRNCKSTLILLTVPEASRAIDFLGAINRITHCTKNWRFSRWTHTNTHTHDTHTLPTPALWFKITADKLPCTPLKYKTSELNLYLKKNTDNQFIFIGKYKLDETGRVHTWICRRYAHASCSLYAHFVEALLYYLSFRIHNT